MLDPMSAMVSLHQQERMEQAAWARVVAEARRARGRRRWWRSLMWPRQWRLAQRTEAVGSA